VHGIEGTRWERKAKPELTITVISDPVRGGVRRKLLVEDVETGRRFRTSAEQLNTRYINQNKRIVTGDTHTDLLFRK
jgi:hypothetical protein